MVYNTEFRYRINLPKELVGGAKTDKNFINNFTASELDVQLGDGTTLATITLTPRKKLFYSESLLRAV